MKYTVTVDKETYEVVIEDLRSRPIVAYVGGEAFEIYPEAESSSSRPAPSRPALAKATPAASPRATSRPAAPTASAEPASGASLQAVRAPIPGVITAVNVQPGDSVTVGQQICSLEAMKMNNSIRAARAGKIATIHISVGQHVKHSELLAEFENE